MRGLLRPDLFSTESEFGEWDPDMCIFIDGVQETSTCTFGGSAKWDNSCGAETGSISQNYRYSLPFDQAVPLLEICFVDKMNSSKQLFIEALHIIAKGWKQPNVQQLGSI